ncbi:hypothetical protein [Tateyamaria sp.]
MIGIILWSDATERKAVIWCEDQGDLAYFSDPDLIFSRDTFFDVGDVVEFESKTVRNMRLALNPSWAKQNAGTTLADGLRAIPMMQDMWSALRPKSFHSVLSPAHALSAAKKMCENVSANLYATTHSVGDGKVWSKLRM